MEFKSDQAKTWLEDENGKQIALLRRPGNCGEDHTGSGRKAS